MKISRQATKGHLVAGIVLVALSLGFLFAELFFGQWYFACLIFFCGVWGGVELGRYLEFSLSNHQDG